MAYCCGMQSRVVSAQQRVCSVQYKSTPVHFTMSQTHDNRINFEAWFGSQLSALAGNRNAGFVVTMVCFPLIERYLKQRSRSEPNTKPFNQALLCALPELQNCDNANIFWSTYRHGLLHNVALSKESHGLSHDKPILEIHPNGQVWLNPDLFAERILNLIRNDFTTFEGGVSLPVVAPIYGIVPPFENQAIYLGTGMPTGGNRR